MGNLLQSTQLACNIQIDYSTLHNEHLLPFVIELNLEESILNPAPEENQRFCYQLTGVGQDTGRHFNLRHLVLGICDEIKETEITNIAVTIAGEQQTVIFGEQGNVELWTKEKPDPITGCSGLKFNFELDKITGAMEVCFELTKPYSIASNSIFLYGRDITASGLTICGPVSSNVSTCPSIGYQHATVCVPVCITPYATAGITTLHCCGAPQITSGTTKGAGKENGTCCFTLTQNIRIEVPVVFSASAVIKSPSVLCEDATTSELCSTCGEDSIEESDAQLPTTSDYEVENRNLKNSFLTHPGFRIRR